MLRKTCNNGDILPRFYGVAWQDWRGERAICYPVPLNLLAAAARSMWIFLIQGFRPVPVNPRDAYWQGRRDEREGRA